MEILFSILKFIGLIVLAGSCLFVGLYAAEQVRKFSVIINEIEKQFIKEEEAGV